MKLERDPSSPELLITVRTVPDDGGCSPTSSRARVDLPAADGPITATASPGRASKLTPFSTGFWLLACLKNKLSTTRRPAGGGSGSPAGRRSEHRRVRHD